MTTRRTLLGLALGAAATPFLPKASAAAPATIAASVTTFSIPLEYAISLSVYNASAQVLWVRTPDGMVDMLPDTTRLFGER